MQKLHIIDALGPFIEESHRDVINWSKIDFSNLEKSGRLPVPTKKRIIERFDTYLQRIAGLGYNAISIDDLAHLVILPFYKPGLQLLIQDYHALYREVFALAKKYHIKVFVNTDYLFHNDDIDTYLRDKSITPSDFFVDIIDRAVGLFPEISGIILRIGENDGKDVEGAFLSRLALRTPAQANRLLRKLLPLFEHHDKLLVFRTWTVGVYKIGDLIWNEKTFDSIFSSISSDALIISMKFGDTDFMRFLSLNPLFFRNSHKKIIELQTRREWEGMGTYPSFVGWDYHHYLKQLSANKDIVGIHVWCQTGGWAKASWTNITYLKNSSFWNELNTEVTIRIYRNNESVETAIGAFCSERHIKNKDKFIELLKLSDVAIKKGLYIAQLAQKELYFRRTRVPSLIWLTWDKTLLQSPVVYLLRALTPDRKKALREANEAVKATAAMIKIAAELELGEQVINSLQFERATLTLLFRIRHWIFAPTPSRDLTSINEAIRSYEQEYPQHYTISRLQPIRQRRIPKRLLSVFLRETMFYRRRDKMILRTSRLQRRIIGYYLRRSNSHLKDQSMGVEVFFK